MAWLTQILMLYILVMKVQGRIIYDNCDDECTRKRYPLFRRTYKELYEPSSSPQDCTFGCHESDISMVDDCDDICGKNDKLFLKKCPRNVHKKCVNKKVKYPIDYYKYNIKSDKTKKHHHPDCRILKYIKRLPKNHYCLEHKRGKDDNKSKDNKPKVSGKSIDNNKTSNAKNNTPAISSNQDNNKPKIQSTPDQNAKPESNNVAPNNDYLLVEVPSNEEYYNPAPVYMTNYVPAYGVSYPAQYYTVPLSSSLIPVNTGQVYPYIPTVSQNVGNQIVLAPTSEIASPSVANAQIYVPSCSNNAGQLILVPENDLKAKLCNNDGKVNELKEEKSKVDQQAKNNPTNQSQ